MSRITKFLRQSCLVEPYQLDADGEPLHNDFGELQYGDPVKCKCRHEISFRDVQTSNGQLVQSTSRYFLDSSVQIKADYRIDGREILNIAEYINSMGVCEGYEVYV